MELSNRIAVLVHILCCLPSGFESSRGIGTTEDGHPCECGLRKKFFRILDGTETRPHEFPWQAMITHKGNFSCGGTLISDKWVVTASHCLMKDLRSYGVVLGLHDTLDYDKFTQVFRVVKKISHPDFSTYNFESDIGLAKLHRRVKLFGRIMPVCLPFHMADISPGEKLTITGWGKTTFKGKFSPTLRKVEVNYISTSECKSNKYEYNYYISKNMFCAGVPQGGKDACEGDSGGPLVYQNPESVNFLVGIISWAFECGSATAPGVYTKVSNFLDWVKEKTGAGKEFCIYNKK